jgi:hypothetical protein
MVPSLILPRGRAYSTVHLSPCCMLTAKRISASKNAKRMIITLITAPGPVCLTAQMEHLQIL